MVRIFLGSLLALAGAAAAVWSAFLPWYGGRDGADIRVNDLFTGVGVTPHDAALLGSLFLPMGFATLLTALGVLMRSRYVVGAAGALVLGITVLWMVRQAQFSGSLTAGGDGLDTGVAAAVAGVLLLAGGTSLLPAGGRPSAFAEPYEAGQYEAAAPDEAGPYEPGPDEAGPYAKGPAETAPYDEAAAPDEGGPYQGGPYGPGDDDPLLSGAPTLIGDPTGFGGGDPTVPGEPTLTGEPTVQGGAVPPPPPYSPSPPPPGT
jgi:hypothetical protein